VTIVSAHRTPQRLESYARTAAGRGLKVGRRCEQCPLRQLPGWHVLAVQCKRMQIGPHESLQLSQLWQTCKPRRLLPIRARVACGVLSEADLNTSNPSAWGATPQHIPNSELQIPKVIIAGAGGAAHLPGMVAAATPLPVIGVPVTPAGAHLDGLDALLSIVQACCLNPKRNCFIIASHLDGLDALLSIVQHRCANL
jgi:AIR carboxylase